MKTVYNRLTIIVLVLIVSIAMTSGVQRYFPSANQGAGYIHAVNQAVGPIE